MPDWFWQAVETEAHAEHASKSKTATSRTGDGRATKVRGLLFIHGMNAHSHWWDFIAPQFAGEYRVAAMDLTGMGDSDFRYEYDPGDVRARNRRRARRRRLRPRQHRRGAQLRRLHVGQGRESVPGSLCRVGARRLRHPASRRTRAGSSADGRPRQALSRSRNRADAVPAATAATVREPVHPRLHRAPLADAGATAAGRGNSTTICSIR